MQNATNFYRIARIRSIGAIIAGARAAYGFGDRVWRSPSCVGRHKCRGLLTGGALAVALAAALPAVAPRAAADPPAPPPLLPAPPAPAPRPATLAPFAGDPAIEDRLDPAGRVAIAGERLDAHLVRRFYAAHGWRRVWDDNPAAAAGLWAAVLRAGEHGLDPALFHSTVLGRRALGSPASLSATDRDLLLSDAILSYADALSRGAMPVGERPDNEDLRPAPVDIVAALDAAIGAPDPARAIAALAPDSPDYLAMRRAYAEYLALAEGGGRAAGYGARIGVAEALRRARQIAINLERLRWLPRPLPADRLMVDTAGAQLQLFRDDRPVFTTRVVVGEFDKQTPELQSVVRDVLFNPPWNVPPSIIRKEIMPKLAGNRGYLREHHMRWRGPMAIQQEAGPYSSLGRLKFAMNDRFEVYLHDTPEKWRFGAADRRMSHGCVRVENPRVLASLLLDENAAAIDKAIDIGRTHSRALPRPLPVFIVYRTAIVESDGTIGFRGDPYDRDAEVWSYLSRARRPATAERTVAKSAIKVKTGGATSTLAQKTATIGD